MKTIKVATSIRAPRARVFQVFADIPGSAERVRAITRIQMQSRGPTAAGTRWSETRTMHGREETIELHIDRFTPPHAYRVVADAHGAHYETTFNFDVISAATGDEETIVTMTFNALPKTMFAHLMTLVAAAMRRSVTKTLAGDLADLKRHLEQPHTQDPSNGASVQ